MDLLGRIILFEHSVSSLPFGEQFSYVPQNSVYHHWSFWRKIVFIAVSLKLKSTVVLEFFPRHMKKHLKFKKHEMFMRLGLEIN